MLISKQVCQNSKYFYVCVPKAPCKSRYMATFIHVWPHTCLFFSRKKNATDTVCCCSSLTHLVLCTSQQNTTGGTLCHKTVSSEYYTFIHLPASPVERYEHGTILWPTVSFSFFAICLTDSTIYRDRHNSFSRQIILHICLEKCKTYFISFLWHICIPSQNCNRTQ